MQLPALFKERMKRLLGEEAGPFFESLHSSRHHGLRINTLKWSIKEALQKLPFHLEPVPWAKEGFYYQEQDRPAKHPYYHAGLYYIQEPSAMAPGALLPIEPGEKVLDLCAAPGGKSTQVAARMKGEGVLVANDISSDRVKALVKNLELFGVRNVVVTNESPQRLAQTFPAYFDKILIDAPCSGEGMFRKNPEMVKSWETHHVEQCALLQEEILEKAAEMLKPGGAMLYSTCTFAPEENEKQVARFLSQHRQFELVDLHVATLLSPGRPDWISDLPLDETVLSQIGRTARLWPHHVRGEGHFLALLVKTEGNVPPLQSKKEESAPERKLADFRRFESELFLKPVEEMADGALVLYKNHLSLKPKGLPDLQGLKVVRSGWYLGEIKKNRFEPSQALAMGLNPKEVQQTVSFSAEDEALMRYLKGETLAMKGEKGWKLVCVDRFPLGWAKQVEGMLKNEYPPAWRWLA
jgi:NOL1/NOP2/sun family putative RNA methylase